MAALDRARLRHRDAPLSRAVSGRGLGRHRGYSELLGRIAELSRAGAELVQYGSSVHGEPLLSLRFGPAAPPPRARTSVVVAGLHPIEWVGIETALTLAERLLTRSLGERTVLVVPMANPDGVLRVERYLRAGRRRFVRHNARAVDLNRNFPSDWGRRSLAYRLLPWVFRPGQHAASEPEVAALASSLSARRVDRALSLHSFGGAVLYPSAQHLAPVADASEHRHWARRIAARCDPRPYRALPCWRFGMGLTTGGLELDWFHQRHGALSLLIECSRGGFGWRPARLLDPFAWFNPRQVAPVARRIAAAAEPFVLGER